MPGKKEAMTSKERVRAAVYGKPVDRPPLFYWINSHAGCRMIAEFRPSRDPLRNATSAAMWRSFKKHSEDESKDLPRLLPLFHDIHALNWANEYGVELGSDILLASFGTPWRYSKFSLKNKKIVIKDVYGVTRGLGGGIYPDMTRPAASTIEDVKNYKFPDPSDPRLYSMFRNIKKKYPHTSIAAEIWGSQDFTATSLIGMENFMMFLVDYPEEMKRFFKRWTDFHVEVIRRCAAAGADIILILDDYGYNNRPLISMKMWKEFTLPHLTRLARAARDCGSIAALHSCGFQTPFLEHYVDAGVQMLQSLQPMAGNDLKTACEQFGDKISFVTGIDTQRGEMMSPEEFSADIIRSYKILAPGGRHILGTTHEIQHTMPNANISAMLKTTGEIIGGARRP